jgi:acetylornithine/N-succinyldiaminopimelate aminotransferase
MPRTAAERSPLYQTYPRAEVTPERGEGAWVIAADGARYLDFMGGIAVNVLGHAHPHLVEALSAQAQKLWHVSNLFQIPGQAELGGRLVAATFADKVFFTNSGAEAVECAIKTARRYHALAGAPERYRLITFEGAFHGRTLATIAAGGQDKYLEGFGPRVEGFDQVPFADHEAVKAAIGPETAGILIEPVQGEGGIRAVPNQCLRGLRDLCDGDRQGYRRRLSARRLSGQRSGGGRHDDRQPWQHFWRQSARHGGRQCRARHRSGGRLSGSCG